MNRRYPYNNIIERKLEQLPVAEADLLWNDMHSLLDKKMPQKKERRRFLFWLLTARGLLLLTFVALITSSSIVFLSTKQNNTTITKESTGKSQPGQLIQSDPAKILSGRKENVQDIIGTNREGRANSAETIAVASGSDGVINHTISGSQKIKENNKRTLEIVLDESLQTSYSRGLGSHIFPINSVNRDFDIVADHNKEIDSLIRKTELMNRKDIPGNRKNIGRGLYTGIISGVDLSSVNFRSLKPGATKGFIFGYAFNKKWSIETGLLWDTKRIYDDGRSFNPPGYTPSSGITIVAVNGKSRLLEWPVNIKYNFTAGENNLFATTGFSSYFMTSENYDYEYKQNNQPGGRNYISYKNETENWFSVVNFSAGYSHKLGKAGSFRVEPYLKLPIKNIGVGKMPMMSTGLNIGFTKTIK